MNKEQNINLVKLYIKSKIGVCSLKFIIYISLAIAIVACTKNSVQKYPNGTVAKETLKENGINVIKLYYPSGALMERIEMQDSIRHGLDETFYEDGKLESKVVYNHGKQKGNFTYYYPSGALMATVDESNHSIFYYESGAIHKEYKPINKEIDGEFTAYTPSSTISQKENFKNGNHYTTELFYSNGTRMEFSRRCENNRLNTTRYFENGQVHSIHDSIGQYRYYFEDGKLESEHTIKDSISEYRRYYPSGILASYRILKNKNPIESKSFFENGTLSKYELYMSQEEWESYGYKKNPGHEKLRVSFYPDSTIKDSCYAIKFGEKDANLCKRIYPGGVLQSVDSLKNDTLISHKFDWDSELVSTCKRYYDKNRLVEECQKFSKAKEK